MIKNNKKAFTLTEILLALVIIGVVASMTIPLVTASSKKHEFSAKLKKFNNTMTNAIDMAAMDTDIHPKKWGLSDTNKDWAFYGPILSEYLKISKTGKCGQESIPDFGPANDCIIFDDGTIVGLESNGTIQNFYIDINGEKGPNKQGKDWYNFIIDSDGVFKPYGKGDTRSNLLENCNSTGDIASNTCAALIELDGWQFKDDYPIKF